MGLNTLNNRVSGQTILETFWNDIHQAMNGDFVGRNTTGVPTAGQNLGTAGVPWGTAYLSQLILAGQAVDASSIVAPANRLVSGKVRGTAGSNLPQFLVPDGTLAQFVLDGTPTNLVAVINGTTTTVTTDITKSGLTLAPSTNNTCLVDDVDATDDFFTKEWGDEDHFKPITVDAMGSEISALVGKWAAFKLAGVTNEYFLAYVESTTKLSKCKRGYFYDSTLAPVKATAYSDNDVITLMKLTHVFLEDDGSTIDVTYNNVSIGFQSPGSPVTGDYWENLNTNQWNRYDGSSFQVINRTLIGIVIQDSTGCVAARCGDFYAKFSDNNSIIVEKFSTEIAKGVSQNVTANVAGTDINFGLDLPAWNITTDLAAAADMHDATEQADRAYYLYLKQNGDTVMSDIRPYRRPDLYGHYHPYNIWRCIGLVYNDGTGDIQGVSGFDAYESDEFSASSLAGSGSSGLRILRFANIDYNNMASLVYRTDSIAGDSFETKVRGLYTFTVAVTQNTNRQVIGFTKNASASERAIDIQSVSLPTVQGYNTTGGSGAIHMVTLQMSLKVGDIVRPHTAGTAASGAAADSGNRLHAHRNK